MWRVKYFVDSTQKTKLKLNEMEKNVSKKVQKNVVSQDIFMRFFAKL